MFQRRKTHPLLNVFTIAFGLLGQFAFAGSTSAAQGFWRIGAKARYRFRLAYGLLNNLHRAIRWSILIAGRRMMRMIRAGAR